MKRWNGPVGYMSDCNLVATGCLQDTRRDDQNHNETIIILNTIAHSKVSTPFIAPPKAVASTHPCWPWRTCSAVVARSIWLLMCPLFAISGRTPTKWQCFFLAPRSNSECHRAARRFLEENHEAPLALLGFKYQHLQLTGYHHSKCDFSTTHISLLLELSQVAFWHIRSSSIEAQAAGLR